MGGQIFHYHGHATFNAADPLDSALHLADGRLTARDILALERGAGVGLATLGACSGGAVQLGTGDEPGGLASALLVGGTQAVCAPLWPVDDREAAIFMRAFYGCLFAEPDCRNIAAALQAAVAELRGDPATCNAYAWAPYVLHGDWLLQ